MLFVIMILAVLLLSSAALLLLNYWNLKKMNQQLKNIIEDPDTNELIRTSAANKEMNHFIIQVNRLITIYKQEQQQTRKKTQELKQEITNISHDLRTPLTSIKGFSDLLQDDSLTEQDKQEYLDIIQKKINTLTMTVDLFYEISQIESADEQIKLEQFTLGDVLVESLLAFHQDFEARNLQVSIDENNLSKQIFADKKATERIIINLIQNALRYGKTTVTFKLVAEKKYLVLQEINDTDNINPENVQHVFERSYTIDASRKDGQTGLGLYIVQKLAEKQGGKAEARLEGENFVLEVYFPR